VPVDLIFLVDSSGSIEKDDFDQSRQYIREVVKRLPLDGGNASTHVGIVQFSTQSFETVEIQLLEGTTQESVNEALDKMQHHKIQHDMNDPMTHTGEGIQYVLDHMFPKIRCRTTEMLVIITDGQSNGIKDPANISALARTRGIEIVAVGVKNYGDDEVKKASMEKELTGIVGDKGKLLTVDKYSELVKIMKNTSQTVCEYAEPTPAPTPRPTEPCPWASPHNMPDRQEPLCEDGAFAWDCVGEGHGHRLQCSSSHPVMCNGTTCGSPSGKNYCCEVKASDCDGLGGVRATNDCPVPVPPCDGCCVPSVPLDLIFLLDSSGSIGIKGFDQSRHFMKKVAKQLPLDHANFSTQVAIVQFSDEGKESVEVPLADGMTYDKVEDAVNTMKWHGKITHDPMTHTGEAIEYLLDNVFPTSFSHDEEAHMLAIITDGKANGKKDPAPIAAKAREKGIEIIAIGVADYDYDELLNMTGDKSMVITVKSHHDLLSIVNETAEVVCKSAHAH
jgi:Mg-chelatase subunit ChlD